MRSARRCMSLLLQASSPFLKSVPVKQPRTRHIATMSLGAQAADVAVVGGGMAGLACALALASRGLTATVVDMGTRTAGGRCCSRPMDTMAFDHGCQLLVPQGEDFREQIAAWEAAGAVQQWRGRLGRVHIDSGSQGTYHAWLATAAGTPISAQEGAGPAALDAPLPFLGGLQPRPVYVGVPSMQAVCAHMAGQLEQSGCQVLLSHKVEEAAWDAQQGVWRLSGSKRVRAAAAEEGESRQRSQLGSFRALVMADSLVALPDSAGYAEVAGAGPEVTQALERVNTMVSDPVFTLMLAFDSPLAAAFDAASVSGASGFQWVSNNSSKPGRPAGGPQCWVAVTTPGYARELMQQFPLHVGGKYNPQTRGYLEGVAGALLERFLKDLGPFLAADGAELQPSYVHAQRWGRGFIHTPLGVPCLAAPQHRFAVCGDFCLGPSAEDAWLSGRAAAAEVAAALGQ